MKAVGGEFQMSRMPGMSDALSIFQLLYKIDLTKWLLPLINFYYSYSNFKLNDFEFIKSLIGI